MQDPFPCQPSKTAIYVADIRRQKNILIRFCPTDREFQIVVRIDRRTPLISTFVAWRSERPLGLIFDHAHKIKLYIDNDVQATRFIALHPCVNNESYVFQTSEFINAFLSAVGHNDYISF